MCALEGGVGEETVYTLVYGVCPAYKVVVAYGDEERRKKGEASL